MYECSYLIILICSGYSTDESSSPWTAYKDKDGYIYYYNIETGESTYDQPDSFN